ncbi:thioredoxin-disulfide reductase [Ruania suaedae]|uniref:thioredoxin-disulfide reductase n=1 Tax=Ruania suaedae TaxID=2897774 RepID=UPI001E5655F3|nr:thioredoxin-disulfide reductase [Ruania suaedae]UFU03027.1 thioredoxin-disulfide reductase [Ruania suaedae]
MSSENARGVHDVVIIGSGPSGYTAAVYAARAGLAPIVFAGAITAGGALMNTTEVENFPGFPEAVMGPDLMEKMRQQAERFGADIRYEDVASVQLDGPVKTIVTDDDEVLQARAVILSTGSAYKELGIPEEKQFSGRGVSWCATCDGFFFRDQDILVVGGGDSAMEEALFLTRFGRTVTIVHRRDELRASKIMADRALAEEKISFAWNSEVAAIHGDQKVSGVTLRDTVTGELREMGATAVFVAIGHLPRTELVTGQVTLNDEGYIDVEHPSTRTNIPGVFAAGDVVDHHYRQAITAAGTGCSAALDAERYLAALDAAPAAPEAADEAATLLT